MRILLVRHGRAGSKAGWTGDDRLRPLTARGMSEARALVPLLSSYGPTRILSSPAVRCTQTVDPLAAVLDVTVRQFDALGPAADGLAEALVRSVGGSTEGTVVMSTHREVIRRLQWRLGRRSGTAFRSNAPCPKGSTWLLDWADGELAAAVYLPPPNDRDSRLRESA
jgi:broad specificity phosphatase PhoE